MQVALAAGALFTSRLGSPQEHTKLVKHIFEIYILNCEAVQQMPK